MKTLVAKLILVGLFAGSLPIVAGDKNKPDLISSGAQPVVQVEQVKKEEGISALSIARGIAYTSMATVLAGFAHHRFSDDIEVSLALGGLGLLSCLFGGSYLAYKEMTEKDATKTSKARKIAAFAIALTPIVFFGGFLYGRSQIRSSNGGRVEYKPLDFGAALSNK